MHAAALQPVRWADAAAHAAQTCERWTLWVKGPHGGYGKIKGVDSEQDVYDFTARWVSDKKLNVDPTLVSLRLVRCAGEEPTAEEEAAATVLIPRRTLREAGVADGSSLLALFSGASSAGACRMARAVLADEVRFCVYGLRRTLRHAASPHCSLRQH
jgi:hypothetical protein